MLDITGLGKTYRRGNQETEVLNNISVSIAKGEYIVITGESGSGKTTLLHILAGLLKPTSGQVLLNHQDIYQLSDRKISKLRNEKIGMIFQEFYLEEDLSVLQNVLFPKYVRTKWKTSDEKKGREILDEVGLLEKADTITRYLSGGQKQRVAIARALINNPDIILADEPTANLDRKTGKEILDLLHILHKKKNVTVVLVTHESNSIHADRTFELKNGKLTSKAFNL
jgi:ABC-type lipoprotein export system ATPase subunit